VSPLLFAGSNDIHMFVFLFFVVEIGPAEYKQKIPFDGALTSRALKFQNEKSLCPYLPMAEVNAKKSRVAIQNAK
jgi:hypothetical protein